MPHTVHRQPMFAIRFHPKLYKIRRLFSLLRRRSLGSSRIPDETKERLRRRLPSILGPVVRHPAGSSNSCQQNQTALLRATRDRYKTTAQFFIICFVCSFVWSELLSVEKNRVIVTRSRVCKINRAWFKEHL